MPARAGGCARPPEQRAAAAAADADAAGELVARHARECGSLVADSLEQVRRRAAALHANKHTKRHIACARACRRSAAGGRKKGVLEYSRAGGSGRSARAESVRALQVREASVLFCAYPSIAQTVRT